jgi:hypothetical protein
LETLVPDLVAIIRRTAGDPVPLLEARLSGERRVPARETLRELARRARVFGASDEEIALSLGALFATERAFEIAP